MLSTFIIAEAGANHDRNFKQALKLIDIAKESGANAVKFQTYSSETLYCSNTPDFAGYTNINKLIKDIELPREWQSELKKHCDEVDIEFMSTPFDEAAVDELVNLGVKRLKISGFESTDFRFVEMVASSGLPLIISLGIGFDHKWIDKLMKITTKYNDDLTLLHCNNAYPTPMRDVNLGILQRLVNNSNDLYTPGFSDHTLSTLTPALAVILGAQVVEKHFTIDKSLPGPDHPFALEPHELKEMIENVRDAELTLQTDHNKYTDSEQRFVSARRSIVSTQLIKKGESLNETNITTKRPYLDGCISATDYESVLGSRVLKEMKKDMLICHKDIDKHKKT